MTDPQKGKPKSKSRLGLLLWITGMLAAISVALFLAPVQACPICQTSKTIKGYTVSCSLCRGSGRISFRQKWFDDHVVAPIQDAVK